MPLLGGKNSTARTGYGKSYNDAANENSSSQVGLKNEIFTKSRASDTVINIEGVPLSTSKAATIAPSKGILVEKDFDTRSDRNLDV
ncbi:MAG: hypothetical protein Q9187_007279 [Circinaria calcarea]